MLFHTLSLLALAGTAFSAARWETLPPTPALPAPISAVKASINGVQLWYQKYNAAAGGTPIVMIHGGLGYSAYFGDVITQLSQSHYVIAVDRRGHGRSTYLPNDVFTFDQFAKDTYDLLAAEGVSKSIWVGWSDGAITALAGLLNSQIKSSITKAFVFAASEDVASSNATFTNTAIYSEFVTRCRTEYGQLQPNANFTDFGNKVATMEGTLPTWTDADMARIDGSKVVVVGAERDEAVNLDVAPHLAKVIKGSRLKILTGVSHFAPVQDPTQFRMAIEELVNGE
jgi:pimeloyl-ACP methyl ester carboxylesterase